LFKQLQTKDFHSHFLAILFRLFWKR